MKNFFSGVFSGNLGEFGQNSFAPPKSFLRLHLWCNLLSF